MALLVIELKKGKYLSASVKSQLWVSRFDRNLSPNSHVRKQRN